MQQTNRYPLYSDYPAPAIEGVHIDWVEYVSDFFFSHLKETHPPDCPTCLWCWNQLGQELINLNTEVGQLLGHLRAIYERAEGIEDEWAEGYIERYIGKWQALYEAVKAPFPIDKFHLPLTHRPFRDVINEAGIRFAKEIAKHGQVEM